MKGWDLHWDKPKLLENEQAHLSFSSVLLRKDIQNISSHIYFERLLAITYCEMHKWNDKLMTYVRVKNNPTLHYEHTKRNQ